MKLSQKDLAKINSYFKNKPVERAYLFGSQAREEADPESDIDILVELDYSQKIGLGFVKMQQELESLLQTKVDLVSSRGVSKYLQPIIDQEKQLIYER